MARLRARRGGGSGAARRAPSARTKKPAATQLAPNAKNALRMPLLSPYSSSSLAIWTTAPPPKRRALAQKKKRQQGVPPSPERHRNNFRAPARLSFSAREPEQRWKPSSGCPYSRCVFDKEARGRRRERERELPPSSSKTDLHQAGPIFCCKRAPLSLRPGQQQQQQQHYRPAR